MILYKNGSIILGDFNGHIGFLGPQPINTNGELMLDLIDKDKENANAQ